MRAQRLAWPSAQYIEQIHEESNPTRDSAKGGDGKGVRDRGYACSLIQYGGETAQAYLFHPIQTPAAAYLMGWGQP